MRLNEAQKRFLRTKVLALAGAMDEIQAAANREDLADLVMFLGDLVNEADSAMSLVQDVIDEKKGL